VGYSPGRAISTFTFYQRYRQVIIIIIIIIIIIVVIIITVVGWYWRVSLQNPGI